MRPRTCGSGMLLTRRSDPPPVPCSPAVAGAAGTATGMVALLSACELNRAAEQEDAAQKASRKKQSIALVFTNALPSSRRERGSLPRLTLRDVHTVECGTQPPRQLLRVVVGPEVHEEEARAFCQHWLCSAVTSMPLSLSALMSGLTSLAISTKSPVTAALPPPVGWKLMAVARPIAGGTSIPLSLTVSANG